jgi:hypothetical protein
MSEFIVRDTDRGNERPVESRAKAEEVAEELRGMGASVEIIPPGKEDNVDVVEHDETPKEANTVEPDSVDAEALNAVAEKDIATDPLSVMPKHFVDQIQGVPTINRKGYAVLAEHFNVSVTAEPITLPSETDFEYAEFRAVATTEDGQEYSGFGSAHINRQDGDDPHLLAELAETRAMKRATAWATGVGITAYTEMSNSL